MNKYCCQRLRALAVAVVTAMVATVSAQVEVEYFIDTDPGQGEATLVTTPVDADGNLIFTPPTTGLAPGTHLLGVRAMTVVDDETHFAPTMLQTFYVPRQGTDAQITRVEYFWDADPGFGQATAISLTAGSEVNLTDIEISTAGLAAGTHQLGIRAFGNEGWGPTMRQEVYVPASAEAARITYVEYFWDTDPGFNAGTALAIAAGNEVSIEDVEISTADLSAGLHTLGIRAYGNEGWGPTLWQEVSVPFDESAIVFTTEAEYFFDEDPGFGNGTPFHISEAREVNIEDMAIPTTGLAAGEHVLGVRYQGVFGWSPTWTTSFVLEVPIDEESQKVLQAEYFWNEDPGFGNGTPVTLSPAREVTVSELGIPTAELHDDATLFIRYRGTQGWGPTLSYQIRINAEGNYTLNAGTATDAVSRTFQTMADMATEFTERGIGDDIIVTVPTTGMQYALDATSEDLASQLAGQAEELKSLSTTDDVKTITFRGDEGSGNTIAVTTTSENLPTVVDYFAQTRLENISLTINGAAYDFNITDLRTEEVCGGVGTTALPLTGISSTLTATWEALPQSAITGHQASGTGDLPSMQLQNSAATTAALTYLITLSDGDGRALTSYNYTITVRPLVGGKTISGMSPADGSVTATEQVTLRWGAVAGAVGGYRLTVSSLPIDDESADPQVATYDTEATSYALTIEEGRIYTWTVTAYGSCDDVTGTSYTFTTRRLDVDDADLAALRQLYSDFGGQQWNGTAWDITFSRITSGNWSGVTFDLFGHVTAVNLQGRGLVGELSSATAPQLSHVTTLNLSRNALTGNPAAFTNGLSSITSLNLGYNQIDELTGALPATITTLDLTNQHRQYGNNVTWPGLEHLATQAVSPGSNNAVTLTTVGSYNHTSQTFGEHPNLDVYTPSGTQLGTLTWSAVNAGYTFSAGSRTLTVEQDADVVLIVGGSNVGRGSAQPATLHFIRGDANLSGLVDVNDVQRTLNYVLDTNNSTAFGLWSANSYTEYETEPVVNVQDIVCTVDIVLDNENSASAGVKSQAAQPYDEDSQAANLFYTEGRKVLLTSVDEIAAFDLELAGVSASQIRLMLNGRDWQMSARNTATGVRLVVFSPTGATLPAGTTELLRLGAEAVAVSVQATSAEAEEMDADVARTLPTGIMRLSEDAEGTTYDLAGRRIAVPRRGGVYIFNGKKVLVK